jgi:DNA-binding SARP family transcriptional activator
MEFFVLGPLEVRTEHGVLDIGGDRQRKVLAILLLSANLVIPVEQLIDELWSKPPQG